MKHNDFYIFLFLSDSFFKSQLFNFKFMNGFRTKKRKPRGKFGFSKAKTREFLFCFYEEAQARKRKIKLK